MYAIVFVILCGLAAALTAAAFTKNIRNLNTKDMIDFVCGSASSVGLIFFFSSAAVAMGTEASDTVKGFMLGGAMLAGLGLLVYLFALTVLDRGHQEGRKKSRSKVGYYL